MAVALPIMLQNGITNFVNMLDNIMVGRVGTDPMTGVSRTCVCSEDYRELGSSLPSTAGKGIMKAFGGPSACSLLWQSCWSGRGSRSSLFTVSS